MADDLSSEFEYGLGPSSARKRPSDGLAAEFRPAKQHHSSRTDRNTVAAESDRLSGREFRQHMLGLDAYARHKRLINEYVLMQPGVGNSVFERDTRNDRTDLDVIRENHRFLWQDGESAGTYEQRLAKRYYDKLFREYCIADLSRFMEGRIAMRWRVEKEVVQGKGQFICGNKRCDSVAGLTSWEVNFAYAEKGERHNALVKLRLCASCGEMLNYKQKRRKAVKRRKRNIDETDEETVKSETEQTETKTQHSETEESESKPTNEEEEKQKLEASAAAEDIWSQPMRQELEGLQEARKREAELDEFLDDLLM